jgi:hypothetical protein
MAIVWDFKEWRQLGGISKSGGNRVGFLKANKPPAGRNTQKWRQKWAVSRTF